jgi:hypothetical protein
VQSFLAAVHHFTAVRISRAASYPIDAAVLAWLPIIGILCALLEISFYVPLAAFYFPMDVAVVPGLIATSWLRGFKPEIDFCQLCDLLLGHRNTLRRIPSRVFPEPHVSFSRCCLSMPFFGSFIFWRPFDC